MNRMNHPILFHGEVIHLPEIQNRKMEVIAVKVAAERDQPALVEVHQDTQMMEVMEEMVVTTTHTTLVEAMTRVDAPTITGIGDIQYQWRYIRGTIPLA